MNYKFRECMRKKYLARIPLDKELVKKELKGAEYDLNRAENSLAERDYKWCIVQSYYSMFHAIKSLVLSRGYREKRHYCLLIAFKTLFVDENIIEEEYLRIFEESMDLRESADYGLTYSKEAAEELVDNAEKLLEKTKSILKKEQKH